MTAVLEPVHPPEPLTRHAAAETEPWLKRPLWNRFTPLQITVMTLATIAPLVVTGAIAAGLLGVISAEAAITLALAAGENPGMITFGAMFLASPVQWLTGRSQIRVRKYLGIMFFLLALSNGAMFVIESGLAAAVGAPFLLAGTIALLLALPLFLTSNRWSQRTLGMSRWRLLHKLTYFVAAALLIHVVLIGDVGPGATLIALGFIARIPAVRRWLTSVADRRKHRGGAKKTLKNQRFSVYRSLLEMTWLAVQVPPPTRTSVRSTEGRTALRLLSVVLPGPVAVGDDAA